MQIQQEVDDCAKKSEHAYGQDKQLPEKNGPTVTGSKQDNVASLSQLRDTMLSKRSFAEASACDQVERIALALPNLNKRLEKSTNAKFNPPYKGLPYETDFMAP